MGNGMFLSVTYETLWREMSGLMRGCYFRSVCFDYVLLFTCLHVVFM